MALQARVRNGRLELSEPTNLPEGALVELMPVDDVYDELDDGGDDDMDDEERAALHAAIDDGLADMRAGRTVPAETVIAQLLAK
jgi:hypothetical protein